MSNDKAYHHGNLAQAIIQLAAEIIAEKGVEALSLRGLARDLGVSHNAPSRHFKNKAALLTAVAAEGWAQATAASLSAAQATGSDDAHVRLNAMGQGVLRWGLANQAMFRTLYHPDVNRHASEDLVQAIKRFKDTVRDAVAATQKHGRHPDVPLHVLTLFTNAVPTGAALLLTDPLLADTNVNDEKARETLIAEVMDLVVPLVPK